MGRNEESPKNGRVLFEKNKTEAGERGVTNEETESTWRGARREERQIREGVREEMTETGGDRGRFGADIPSFPTHRLLYVRIG